MGSPVSKIGLLMMVLVILGAMDCGEAKTEDAYVTLLYGDEFLLGVRVLGKSIRDTGSTKDMIALVSDGVSDYAKNLLHADGWVVQHISLLANPNQVRPKRFWGVYTKLKIFNMTDYRKVVYLDADTIVIKSIEDLFKCGKFCANLKHSERLNSGVLVVEPSESTFKDMMSKVTSLYSYTGGDQGFLNSYYSDFPNAHVFEPNLSSDPKSEPEMQRLSTLYNADVGLYMLANKWMVDEKELKIIHYTLGPLKPWDWWTAWLLKPVDVWQNVRQQLEESLPGTGGGTNPHDHLFVKILFAFPICLLFLCYYRSFLQINRDFTTIFSRSSICDSARRFYYRYRSGGLPTYSAVGVASSSFVNQNQQISNGASSKLPAHLGPVSIFVCFMAVALSLGLSFILVPRQVLPWTGLLLMYEWTFTSFFIMFGSYLNFIYQLGKSTAVQTNHSRVESSDYDSGKGSQRNASNCDIMVWFYWLGIALLAIIAPSLPLLLGITALFTRLGLMVGGGLILTAFMTFASEHLAIRAFIKGSEDRHQPRNRSGCFLC
ncbi:inositol phosphorylceramide glucuronosyltransferase 1-like [Canna indica]|uniref:Hexosyltransferase n=1 Tax=Canna indica TaxID=4628 RepID=A0AAQ3L203_9LILI|nr:inositol phosphorylceramide glucuronosyltransferase 1-like [Canna indica]